MFRQRKGGGIGASNSCDYADIAMSLLDDLVHGEELVSVHKQSRPIMFARFRDDIFIIWKDSYEQLIKFYNFLNDFHPDIKFTMTELSPTGI